MRKRKEKIYSYPREQKTKQLWEGGRKGTRKEGMKEGNGRQASKDGFLLSLRG